jgi:hypothetical protein
MTKGQEWADEFYIKFDIHGVIKPLPDFLDRKIEELRDEYQKLVLEAWEVGFKYAKHLNDVFGGSK